MTVFESHLICFSGPEKSTNDPATVSDASKPKKKDPAVFTCKENATWKQCIEILDWYHQNGKNQSKTVKHFAKVYPNLTIKQPLVSTWVKDEAKWQDKQCTLLAKGYRNDGALGYKGHA